MNVHILHMEVLSELHAVQGSAVTHHRESSSLRQFHAPSWLLIKSLLEVTCNYLQRSRGVGVNTTSVCAS